MGINQYKISGPVVLCTVGKEGIDWTVGETLWREAEVRAENPVLEGAGKV